MWEMLENTISKFGSASISKFELQAQLSFIFQGNWKLIKDVGGYKTLFNILEKNLFALFLGPSFFTF